MSPSVHTSRIAATVAERIARISFTWLDTVEREARADQVWCVPNDCVDTRKRIEMLVPPSAVRIASQELRQLWVEFAIRMRWWMVGRRFDSAQIETADGVQQPANYSCARIP